MAIFVDSSKYEEIERYHKWGICFGVTTNPKILVGDGTITPDRLQAEVLKIVNLVKAPVSIEIVSEDTGSMINEARLYHQWAPRHIVIKVPICAAGMPVIRTLSGEGIATNCTCLMNFNQAYMAALAGATYVSLFVGRIRDMGYDPMPVVRSVREMLDKEGLPAKIIAGSIRHHQDVAEALQAGAHIVTVTPPVLDKAIQNPQSDLTIKEFAALWCEFQTSREEVLQ